VENLAHHPLHKVHASVDHFGDAMFHLNARVDLQKVKILPCCAVEEVEGGGG
jgi:hypothetical protein